MGGELKKSKEAVKLNFWGENQGRLGETQESGGRIPKIEVPINTTVLPSLVIQRSSHTHIPSFPVFKNPYSLQPSPSTSPYTHLQISLF